MRIYDDGCDLCPLGASSAKVCYPGEGASNPRVLIVGDNPSKGDEEAGHSFRDDRAQLLAKTLKSVGFSLGKNGDVFVTYAVKCFPWGKASIKDAKICAENYLHKEIAHHTPELVITLGKAAQVAVLGNSSPLSKTHGKLFEYDRDGVTCQVMPVDHPFAVLMNPSKYDIWHADLKRAYQVLHSQGDPYWSKKKVQRYNFVPILSKTHLEQVVYSDLKKFRGKPLVFDNETSGLDDAIFRPDFRFFTLQFGVCDTKVKENNDTLPVYILPIHSQHWDFTGDAWLEDIRPILQDLFAPGAFKFVAHNAKYDAKVLWRFKIPVLIDACSMVLWADEHGEASASLKEIAYQVTDIGGYEKEMEEYFKEHGTYDAPPEILNIYGGLDIIVTRYLYFELAQTILKKTKRI